MVGEGSGPYMGSQLLPPYPFSHRNPTLTPYEKELHITEMVLPLAHRQTEKSHRDPDRGRGNPERPCLVWGVAGPALEPV